MTIIARKPAAKAKTAPTNKAKAKTPARKPAKSAVKAAPKKAVAKKAVKPKKAVAKKAVKKAAVPAKKAAAKTVAAKKAATKKVAPKKAVAKKVAAPKVAKPVTAKKPVAAKKPLAARKPVVAKKPVAPKAGTPVVPKADKPVAPKASKPVAPKANKPKGPTEQLLDVILRSLDDGKAEDVVAIDMAGKSAVADYMVIATGRSQRQLGALAENLRAKLKSTGKRVPHAEGLTQGDWVLLDAGDVVVHLFRPEIRTAYNLEKMWSQPFEENNSGMEGMIKERQVQHNAAKAEAHRGPAKPDFRKRGGKRPSRF
ncbi:MAG TPA: ribosome silencing factor [Alphaproteobacteria bacterium]